MAFPNQINGIEELVNSHVQTLDEDQQPLALAIYYGDDLSDDEEYLFEVAHGFGGDQISGIREMMQVEFGPSANLGLNGSALHLTLTNPHECAYAVNQRWPEVMSLVDSIRKGRYQEIYRRPGDIDADEIARLLGF